VWVCLLLIFHSRLASQFSANSLLSQMYTHTQIHHTSTTDDY
jgi:hypothetical protein